MQGGQLLLSGRPALPMGSKPAMANGPGFTVVTKMAEILDVK